MKQSLAGGVIAHQTGDQVNVGGYDACRLMVCRSRCFYADCGPQLHDQQRSSRVYRLPHETRESEYFANQGAGHGPQ